MKNLTLYTLMLFLPLFSIGQLQVETEILDDQVLDWLNGEGVNVTNLVIDCESNAYGTFFNPDSTNNLDVLSGLLMTTGDAMGAIGPNNMSGNGSNGSQFQGDVDLAQAVDGFEITDVCRIEFDIVPAFDNILFNYVFGSEEYPEWVNSAFNDVFGFYVSGPGIDGAFSYGAENFSLVPGTDLPVAINSVNNELNEEFYVENGDGNEEPFYSDPMYVQYDGFTTNLIGNVAVIAGESYHVKIAVADAGDSAFDSGVFLQKDCFKSLPSIVGVQELEKSNIMLYPNPASDMLNLTGEDLSDVTSFTITGVDGKTVQSGLVTSETRQISISNLAGGFYMINLYEEDKLSASFRWTKEIEQVIKTNFMKNLTLFTFLLFLPLITIAQLQVETYIEDEQVLDWLNGEGVNVTNLEIDCENFSYGTFFNPDSINNLEVVTGLLMTTGDAEGAIGPNDAASFTGFFSETQGDYDLAQSTEGFDITDVCRIEFDIVPGFDNIIFNYVFGSDEYPEFVNSSYNDVFGFFVSGPGIEGPFSNGAENFSLVPGTDIPVAINNVNIDLNSEYYRENGDGIEEPYSTDPTYVQYDGITTNLLGDVSVIAGESYHVKIAVADAGDSSFDSGVFLQKDCFKSLPSIVGVQELEKSNIMLYPNPASDMLNLTGEDLSDVTSFTITGVDGKTVQSGLVTSETRKISISNLAGGFYMINLYEEDKLSTSIRWTKK